MILKSPKIKLPVWGRASAGTQQLSDSYNVTDREATLVFFCIRSFFPRLNALFSIFEGSAVFTTHWLCAPLSTSVPLQVDGFQSYRAFFPMFPLRACVPRQTKARWWNTIWKQKTNWYLVISKTWWAEKGQERWVVLVGWMLTEQKH